MANNKSIKAVLVALICTLSISVAAPGAVAQTDSSDLGDAHIDLIDDAKSTYNDAADAAFGDARDEVETGAIGVTACAATSGGCAAIGTAYLAKHALDDDSELS